MNNLFFKIFSTTNYGVIFFIVTNCLISSSVYAAKEQDSPIHANPTPIKQLDEQRRVPGGGFQGNQNSGDPRHDPACTAVSSADIRAAETECELNAACGGCPTNYTCTSSLTAVWKDSPPMCLLGYDCDDKCVPMNDSGGSETQTESQ